MRLDRSAVVAAHVVMRLAVGGIGYLQSQQWRVVLSSRNIVSRQVLSWVAMGNDAEWMVLISALLEWKKQSHIDDSFFACP